MSLNGALQIGRSAIVASQAAMQVAGNNMANAATKGFHRRTVHLAGARDGVEMIVQRARPTLFSNALPCTVAASAEKAIEILMNEPQRVEKLRENVAYARAGIRKTGFEVLESPTAICPIIVGDTAEAIRLSNRLLDLGVFVIGFGYPVVPEGTARLRVQISAAHEREHLDRLIGSLAKLKAELG